MTIFGRRSLKSGRARIRQIDRVFLRIGECLLIANFLFIVASWTSEREVFRINTVEVLGAQATDVKAVKDIAGKFLSETLLWRIERNNALLYPKADLAFALGALDSHIKTIHTTVVAKKTLKIEVIEYTPRHLWCTAEASPDETATSTPSEVCYLADETGYVYASAPNYSGYPFDVYRTNIAGSQEQGSPIGLFMLPKVEFGKVAAIIDALERADISVSEVTQLDPHDYSFKSNKPWVLVWSSDKDPRASVETLRLATDEITRSKNGTTTVSSIDLRFGNKIFYK